MTSLSKQEKPARCSSTASQFIDKTDIIVGTKRMLSNLLPLCYNLRYNEVKLNSWIYVFLCLYFNRDNIIIHLLFPSSW